MRDCEIAVSSSEAAGEYIDPRVPLVDGEYLARQRRRILVGVLFYLSGSTLVALTAGAIAAGLAPESASLPVLAVVASLVAVLSGLRVRRLLGLSLHFTGRFLP